MGAGDNSQAELPFLRSIFVFNGSPIGVDTISLNEFAFDGKHPADVGQLIDAVGRDYPNKEIYVLVPAGEPPFRELSYFARAAGAAYLEHPPLFDDKFCRDFAARFTPIESTPHFDVYKKAR
jgi:hypothetical protein